MRGEHPVVSMPALLNAGSSPHARGTRHGRPYGSVEGGIIPACAGNTRRPRRRRVPARDHPRMRGEHTLPTDRMVEFQRIIPACAGNTCFLAHFDSFLWDHPRMRGEHQSEDILPNKVKGSSPHARGTPAMIHVTDGQPGIIPACAGNTGHLAFSGKLRLDHPRMRGEHLGGAGVHVGEQGSSPHARGTRFVAHAFVPVVGIIPACAGNTSRIHCIHTACRDHPRMRGEHSLSDCQRAGLAGSSPHARGTQPYALYAPLLGGIIPACAGNTGRGRAGRRSPRDHPRMRGEHPKRIYKACRTRGSSPHARGTHHTIASAGHTSGIIPACAGNTGYG